MTKIDTRGLFIASVGLLAFCGMAHAEISAPAVGQIEKYSCTGPYGKELVYTITSVEDGEFRADIERDGKTEWVLKPVRALGTSLATKRQPNDGKGVRRQSLDEDELMEYAKLTPGSKQRFNVRDRHDNGKWEWGYTIEVGEPETVNSPILGEVKVVPVKEGRKVWKGKYSSKLDSKVVPELGTSLSWVYKDDKGKMVCELVEFSRPQS